MNIRQIFTTKILTVSNFLNALAAIPLIVSLVPKVRFFLSKYYLVGWISFGLVLIGLRIAPKINVRSNRNDRRLNSDLNNLAHRLYNFEVDSIFISQLRNLVREDKIPTSVYEGLILFDANLKSDGLEIRNRKLRSAFDSLREDLSTYLEYLEFEYDHLGNWTAIPENSHRNDPTATKELISKVTLARMQLIASYFKLMNLIADFGGDVRRKTYISS